jgi:hypothetical protein
MAAPKNHYSTIGVAETASADEIKKAYRKLAKKYHPDVNQGDKAKEAKFKEITEAYGVPRREVRSARLPRVATCRLAWRSISPTPRSAAKRPSRSMVTAP